MSHPAIVVLTGAGISAESGLKTFRDAGGLWEGHRMEEVATPEAFAANPGRVQRFYNARRAQLASPQVDCNAAHRALAEFEKTYPGEFLLITQNVDDLHQRAGSERLLPMHGELLKARCQACGSVTAWRVDIDEQSSCAHCPEVGKMRPHIVWFGEMPLYMEAIEQALLNCSCFVSVGTSSAVYPAAGFQQLARSVGARTIELNLKPSDAASEFDEAIYGPATEVVPAFLAGLA